MREVSGRAVHEAVWKSWPRRSGPGASDWPWTSAEDRALFGGLSGDALMAAALACAGEADFRRRIREQRGLRAGLPPSPDPER